jgi:hypothetical protein
MTWTLLALPAWGMVLILLGGRSISAADEASASSGGYKVIEDFTNARLDSLPREWTWRSKDDDKPKLYAVKKAAGRRYLAAQDSGSSVVILKEIEWDPRAYPIMSWCWRVNALPPGGDERYTETNDSAAGIYIFFSKNILGIPRLIKYLWSTTLPVGTIDRREGIARPWFVVLKSGEEKMGRWVQEQVDLQTDHQRILDRDLPKNTLGIGILTDANSTHTYAAADYADFRLWPRSALKQGPIPNHCSCLEKTVGQPAPSQ